MTSLPKTIAEMTALMADASGGTRGQWKAVCDFDGSDWLIGTGQTHDNKTWHVVTDHCRASDLGGDAESDARLIALMRNTLPALLAERESLAKALHAYVSDDECKYGMDGECDANEPQCRFCSGRAALSPTQEQP